MSRKDRLPEHAAELRRLADAKAVADEARITEPLSIEETRIMVHELQVHQIELEMQNEELRRTQYELETARACYFDLYNLAPLGYFTISEKGLILESDLTLAALLGVPRSALVKRPITQFILKEDQHIYYLHRKQLFKSLQRRQDVHSSRQQ